MKAPDEIYVLCDEDGSVYAASEVMILPEEDIKYLRADLAVKKWELMEWLEKEHDRALMPTARITLAYVIDRLKTL